jgi:hypothetical protein
MATDFGEKERQFIEGLKENTGRDLDEWMQAITAAALPHRNDIIDWLRHKGLMFSKASWLERIHHNGGRPIYAGVPKDAAPRRPPQRRRVDGAAVVAPAAPVKPLTAEPPAPPAVKPAGTPISGVPGDIEALLAKAKAYRPLAQHVLAKLRQAAPDVAVSAGESAVSIGAPSPFARLGISARELRLHLDLGEYPFDEVVKKGSAGGGLGKGEAMSHMLVLTDARQVDAHFMELIALAAARANR